MNEQEKQDFVLSEEDSLEAFTGVLNAFLFSIALISIFAIIILLIKK